MPTGTGAVGDFGGVCMQEPIESEHDMTDAQQSSFSYKYESASTK